MRCFNQKLVQQVVLLGNNNNMKLLMNDIIIRLEK